MAMRELQGKIARKRAEFEQRLPKSGIALSRLQKYYDVELTYTSNALAGNALTLRETAELIEEDVVVGGKTLSDHLDAVDYYDAVRRMREIAVGSEPVGEETVQALHRRMLRRSQPDAAGAYATTPRRVAGSSAAFPEAANIPPLMSDFGSWLQNTECTPDTAFEALFRLAAIHPFADGVGRVARLLMNLMLVRGGYPPVAIHPDDRKPYFDALERGLTTGDLMPLETFMHARLDATLSEYLGLLHDGQPEA